MSYELRRGETVGQNLRRICRKQIEAAITHATGGQTCKNSPVHETRRHLKKARAALRLARRGMDRGVFQVQDIALRDAGRLVSEIRDAEVRLETVQHLERLAGQGKRFREVEGILVMELENFMTALAEWQSQAIPLLEKARAAFAHWRLENLGGDNLRAEVQWSYKRARNALALANAQPTADKFHRFRTRAKLLCHQLRIVRPINPDVLKRQSDELGAVAALLGRAHDLSFLGERLRDRGGKEQWFRETEKLLPLVEVSEEDSQIGAAELGEHFFAERPREFGHRLGQWLHKWEQGGRNSVAEHRM